MPTVDQFSDPAFATLYRQIQRMPALEAFVKEAEIDPGLQESLPETAYAWPAQQKFPIHTPEHAALSYAYAKVARALPLEVLNNIKQALDVYRVPETIFTETEEKIATEIAYVLPEFRYLPLQTATQVKVAQERLLVDLQKLDVERRAQAAANFVKKADEHKVPLRPELLKLAGLVVTDTKLASDWIEARANAVTGPVQAAYRMLADGIRQQSREVADRAGLLKVANALAELDAQSGLDRYYDRKLPDALRTVFNTEKVAAGTVDLGGTYVPLSKLAALPASFWEDLGGRELSDEVAPGGNVDLSKLATVVETLPLDLKLILRNQVR